MSVIVPISSGLPPSADVAALGRESPKLTHKGLFVLAEHDPATASVDALDTNTSGVELLVFRRPMGYASTRA